MDIPVEVIEVAKPKPRGRAKKAAPKVEPIVIPQIQQPTSPVSEPDIVPEPKPSLPEHHHPVVAAKNNKSCITCGQKPKKPRKVTAPTQKQLDSRKVFAEKVAAAKQLQAQDAGLKYKDAIKRVYAGAPK